MARRVERNWDDLFARIMNREEAAERELVEKLWPQVAGRIGGLCPRREEVEDLAQVVFLRIFQNLPSYRGGRGGSFELWVDVIARRVCYDALRKQRVRPEWRFSDLDEFDEETVPEERKASELSEARHVLKRLFGANAARPSLAFE